MVSLGCPVIGTIQRCLQIFSKSNEGRKHSPTHPNEVDNSRPKAGDQSATPQPDIVFAGPRGRFKTLEEDDERLAQYSRRIVYTVPDSGLQLPEFITGSHMILRLEFLTVLGTGNQWYVYKCDGDLAYKQHGRNDEYSMNDTGDISIPAFSRVLQLLGDDQIIIEGIIMEPGTPVRFEEVKSPTERDKVKDEMLSLVTRLHSEKRIVHGDIKLSNFLRAKDGSMRLYNWDTPLRLDSVTEAEEWEGGCNPQYTSPNRRFSDCRPSTVEDDMYALAITIWELYTGEEALADEFDEPEELLPQGHTVDVNAVENEEVRERIKAILIAGGACIPDHQVSRDSNIAYQSLMPTANV